MKMNLFNPLYKFKLKKINFLFQKVKTKEDLG
jgi:hypothetical protein